MKEQVDLKKLTNDLRKDIIEMLRYSKSGHPGGSLSCIDILAVLYHKIMNINLDENNNRIDKFILSKGHASPAYYTVLSSVGYIDKELLNTFRKSTSILEGHPSNKIPGVDSSSGSLGQGLSIANGMAIAKKVSNKPGNIYCLLGDGELQEGQVWEAFMSINKFDLNNVIPIIDNNGLQIDGTIDEIKKLSNIKEKIESFGLEVIEINGHDLIEIENALTYATRTNKKVCIIAHTVKGKGVDFMENNVSWHGKALTEEDYINAINCLEK